MSASSHLEKLVSGLGGVISISLVLWATGAFEQALHTNPLFVASMGATAVLLFAAPLAQFSQPWNVFGGHVISALIGVSIHKLIADPVVGGALAVGAAITAMHYLKCLHPPGGATALVAALGGPVVENFGYTYVAYPVGLGAALMIAIAIAFNYPFPWRRYPEQLFEPSTARRPVEALHDPAYPDISHADLVAALAEVDTFVDISEHDLLRIYELATRRAHPSREEQASQETAD